MNERIEVENAIRQLGLRFPNGTVNKDYCACFELPVDKMADIALLGAEELGLVLAIGDDGKCSLSGMPLAHGDFTLRLRFHTADGESASELSYPIAFNPNPRDLWRNIPTDPDIIYYKDDSAHGGLPDCGDGKRIVAASQRGRSHAQEGRPRDDHFSLWHSEDSGWYVMAVADGAGSAQYSRRGSQLACDAVAEHCQATLGGNDALETAIAEYAAASDDADKRAAMQRRVIEILYKGAARAHEAIKCEAANAEARLKDFATTLMYALCKKYDFGWFIATFWVGDGAMCLYDESKQEATLLGTPDEGEFSGQTRFLTMPEIFRDPDLVRKRMRIKIVDDFTALLLMTDGVSDPMFETDKNLRDHAKWDGLWHSLHDGFPADGIVGVDLTAPGDDAQRRLLGWLDFWSPGNHDDRTIMIMY